MNQSKSKKKKLHIPGTFNHSCKRENEYMPIAEVMDITPENALKREAMKGQEARD